MVQMNRFAGQKQRHRCREQTYGHQGGKAAGGGGGGVMNWAIGFDMYTLMCIKLMTNKDLLFKKINKIQKLKIKVVAQRSRGRVNQGSGWKSGYSFSLFIILLLHKQHLEQAVGSIVTLVTRLVKSSLIFLLPCQVLHSGYNNHIAYIQQYR